MGVEEFQTKWAYARCAGLSKEESDAIFFVSSGRPRKIPLYEEYCGGCPILNFCLSYAIVHDEEGVWGGMTRNQRDSLGQEVKDRLTVEAQYQGWYEDRKSIDELVRVMIQQQTRREIETLVEEFLEEEFDLFAGPLYDSPLEYAWQTPLTPDKPVAQLPVAAPLQDSGNDQYADSSESLFGFPSALPGNYLSSSQLIGN